MDRANSRLLFKTMITGDWIMNLIVDVLQRISSSVTVGLYNRECFKYQQGSWGRWTKLERLLHVIYLSKRLFCVCLICVSICKWGRGRKSLRYLTSFRLKKSTSSVAHVSMLSPSNRTNGWYWYWLMPENFLYSASCFNFCSFSKYFPFAGILTSGSAATE